MRRLFLTMARLWIGLLSSFSRARGALLRSDGRALSFPMVGLVALLLSAGSTLASASGEDQAPREFLLTNASGGTGQERLAQEFQERLEGPYRLSLRQVPDTETLIDAVAADPALVGLVRLDLYVDYLNRHPDLVGKLDLYGEMPLCIFAAVTHSPRPGDSGGAEASAAIPRLDLGSQYDTDALFMLRAVWPEVQHANPSNDPKFEFLGGYRAFDRVAKGRSSGAVFLDVPGVDSPRLRFIEKHPDLAIAGVPKDPAAGETGEADLWGTLGARGYIPLTVAVDSGGWFPGRVEVRTVCTSLGVVANNQLPDASDHEYVDSVVKVISAGDVLSGRPYDQMWRKTQQWLRDVTVFAMGQVERGLAALSDLKSNYF